MSSHSAAVAGALYGATPPLVGDGGAGDDAMYAGGAAGTPLLPKGPTGPAAEQLARLVHQMSVSICFVLPCVVFAGTCFARTFGASQGIAVVAPVILLIVLTAVVAWRRKAANYKQLPWHLLLITSTAFSWIVAMVLGSQNRSILSPYYAFSSMPTYLDVDTHDTTGQLFMDAGRILFKAGTHIDVSKAIGFKSSLVYCVAPIVTTGPPSTSYDFWAVGIGCCSSTSGPQADFQCGDVTNRDAAAGLRLLDAGPRAFFRLAVQQAEAAYGIEARHPIFLQWMQDPVAEVNSHWDRACYRLPVQVLSYCTLQVFLVAAAGVILAKNAGS